MEMNWLVIGGDAVDFEVSKIPFPERKRKVEQLCQLVSKKVEITKEVFERATKITGLGIKNLDALHIPNYVFNRGAIKMEMNPAKLRKKGIDALTQALGPLGMVRFLQQYESGSGDYTKERSQWLDELDIETIRSEIKKE